MNKMNKWKILLSVVLVLLVGFVLFLYNGFNGNPVSKYLAKRAMESYLADVYPEEEFVVSDGFYNFKVSGYEFTVTEIGSADRAGNLKEYFFTTVGFVFPDIMRDGIYEENLDYSLATRLSNEINAELAPIFTEKAPAVHDVEFYIEVLKGTYPENVAWSNDLEFEKPMEVFVQVDSTEQTEAEFVATVEAVMEILDEGAYDYRSAMFNGSFIESESKGASMSFLKYSIRVDRDEQVNPKAIETHNPDMW